MEEFKYENSDTYEQNFIRWYSMNCKEKRVQEDGEYSPEHARKVFEKMHRGSLAHTIRVTAKGLLEDVLIKE